MWSGRSARSSSAIGRFAQTLPHHPVVVEHGLAVGGQPHVALEPGGAQPHGQREGLQRVLGGVGPGAPVGEADRRAPQRGEPSGHDGPLCQTGLKRQGGRADI